MFETMRRRFADWRLRQIARRKLSMLDDRLLLDLGTERDCIGDFVDHGRC
jgi:uncharacterized protein YjiS (DUF1127 family)